MNDPFSITEENKKIFIKDSSRDKDIDWFSSFKGESLRLNINKKIGWFLVGVLFFFILLIFIKLFFLQMIEGDKYLKMAQGNEVRIEKILPNRGIIYDRHLEPLVKNVSRFTLYFHSSKFPQGTKARSIILEKLEKIIGKESFLNLDFEKKYEKPLLVKNNLSPREVILFEVEKDSLPGFVLERERSREYIKGKEFSHLLGYTSKASPEDLEKGYSSTEESGKTGAEKYYENWLRGRAGKRRIELRTGERQIITAYEPAEDGKNIVLSIDSELQKTLALALEKWTKSAGGKAGAAVALSPKTGDILALVSFPFFDNNLFSQGISADEYKKIVANPGKPLFFRAISGEYPPGSTIKPIIGLAALEEKIIDEKTSFVSSGGIQAGKWFFADWKKGGHGPTNLKKALAQSVNTFFYLVSAQSEAFRGLGPDKIAFYLEKFGLGKKTIIDLPYEKEGFIPTPEWKKETKNEDWFVGDSYNLGIGHGDIRVTPLQIAVATAAIASEGKLVQPKIIKKIFDSRGNEIIKEDNFFELPFKKENFKLIKDGLREAVVSGTAKALATFPLAVAGKTGTVEVGTEKPHSWFTCFAPAENPEIVVTTIVENGGEGSGPALHIAKEALEWWYQHRYRK